MMTPEAFTEAKTALGFNNESMSDWLGRSRRTVQRYQYLTTDERNSKIPWKVEKLVRHWLKGRGITLEQEREDEQGEG